MKKYKFFALDFQNNIVGSHRLCLKGLSEEFTLDELRQYMKEHRTWNGQDSIIYIPDYLLERMEKARAGTVIAIRKQCSTEMFGVKCLGENSEIDAIREFKSKNDIRLKEISDELNKIAGTLIAEQKELYKINAKLSEQIKYYNTTGEILNVKNSRRKSI